MYATILFSDTGFFDRIIFICFEFRIDATFDIMLVIVKQTPNAKETVYE